MRLSIKRINVNNMTYQKFVDSYLTSETPVILTGVDNCSADELTPEFIKNAFGHDELRSAGWFDATLPDEKSKVKMPALVQQVINRDDMSLRKHPMRVFMQPKGHITLPHYDGNSLHGFNLQVSGSKKWLLTSPNTPLPTLPFMFVALVKKNFKLSANKYDHIEFITVPGDLLFLPRYWFHEVHSLDAVNLNMNWVCTPTYPCTKSKLGQRECELLKQRSVFGFINKLFPDKFSEYGGKGKVITDSYIKNVGLGSMISRLLKELMQLPKALVLFQGVKARADEFSDNNFNIDDKA